MGDIETSCRCKTSKQTALTLPKTLDHFNPLRQFLDTVIAPSLSHLKYLNAKMSELSVNKTKKAISKLERIKMYDGILQTQTLKLLKNTRRTMITIIGFFTSRTSNTTVRFVRTLVAIVSFEEIKMCAYAIFGSQKRF